MKKSITVLEPSHSPSLRLPISAFLVCKNEEDHIAACLESISFCDDIVVVDSFSTDRTVEICKSFNVNFIQREWTGYRDQKEFAFKQTKQDWVIFLDADEVVSKKLQDEILELISNPSDPRLKEYNAFQATRLMYFLGKWWTKGGWYQEKKIRFFRRDKVEWVGLDPHENVKITGKIGDLKGDILHYSYDDIPDQIKKISSHAFTRAKCDFDSGRVVTLWDILARPPARFIKFYIVKRGILEGMSGLIVAIFETFYTFMKYARLWELGHMEALKIKKEKLKSSE